MKRTLILKKERLVALDDDELREVAGGATPLCVGNLSDPFITLCGCLTNICSINAC